METEKTYTVKELADYCNVSPTTVYRDTKEHCFPFHYEKREGHRREVMVFTNEVAEHYKEIVEQRNLFAQETPSQKEEEQTSLPESTAIMPPCYYCQTVLGVQVVFTKSSEYRVTPVVVGGIVQWHAVCRDGHCDPANVAKKQQKQENRRSDRLLQDVLHLYHISRDILVRENALPEE